MDTSKLENPPYTFSYWLDSRPNLLYGDFNPIILYDGYVWSLEQLGYKVYGSGYSPDGVKVISPSNQL